MFHYFITLVTIWLAYKVGCAESAQSSGTTNNVLLIRKNVLDDTEGKTLAEIDAMREQARNFYAQFGGGL